MGSRRDLVFTVARTGFRQHRFVTGHLHIDRVGLHTRLRDRAQPSLDLSLISKPAAGSPSNRQPLCLPCRCSSSGARSTVRSNR